MVVGACVCEGVFQGNCVCHEVCEFVTDRDIEALVCVAVGVGDWMGVRVVGVSVVEGV